MAAICLRELSKDVDPAWAAFLKPVLTSLVFLPVVLVLAKRKANVWPSKSTFAKLIVAGVIVQIAGHLLYQWSLGEIGIALVVPLTIGSMVFFSAVGGSLFLKERISWPLALSLLLLVVSVFVLSSGGKQAAEMVATAASNQHSWLWAGIAAATAGLSFSVLGIAIRDALSTGLSIATPILVTALCGVVILGVASFGRLGWQVALETTPYQWMLMVGAAVCNTLAFLALSISLKKLALVYAHAINLSQVAMAAIVGLTLFSEPLSPWLGLGLILMVIGFGGMTQAARKKLDR